MASVEITPRCTSGGEIFVSSEGWLMPCCYSHRQMRQVMNKPETFAEKDRWFERNRHWFDLKTRAAKDILADARWFELAASWTSGKAPAICYQACGVTPSCSVSHVRQHVSQSRSLNRLK